MRALGSWQLPSCGKEKGGSNRWHLSKLSPCTLKANVFFLFLSGRMAGVATQMGVPQATDLLNETSKGVTNMAGVFGGQVGGPVTDHMQSLADEVAAWMGTGAVVRSGTRALPAASLYSQPGQYQEQAW